MCKSNDLYNLLTPWIIYHFVPVIKMTGIALDSHKIVQGNLFVALKGKKTDGRLYIDHAIENGAIAILSEPLNDKKIEMIAQHHVYCSNIPIIYIKYLDQYLSRIAGRFYDNPSYYLDLIGVTGTNGKTTVTCLLANWVQLLGKKSAVMGTLGYGVLGNMSPSSGTTYSAIDNQKILADFVRSKVACVAMEVSSHGLDQYRVDALFFKVAIFTNLSRDHLDYHGTFMKYIMAKWRFFSELCVEHYIINIDDDIGYKWLLSLSHAVAVTVKNTLPLCWNGRWICVININYYFYGTDIVFNSSWGSGTIHSVLLGEFNVINILLALGALLVLGYPLSALLRISSQLCSICGRMEMFRSYGGQYPTVVIDYAHTPDALKKVLILIKQYCRGKLWCIFGCGGDRDQGKRSLMGAIAEKYSDYVIVTNDNPRTENPQAIIDDILCGIKYVQTVEVIPSRFHAICTIIKRASAIDMVLVAGKGHEKFQIIGKDRIYHSDRDIVTNILKDS